MWPLAGVVHQLVRRDVGPVDEGAPLEHRQEQLKRAARMADEAVVAMAQSARTELIVSAVVYGGAPTAAVRDRAGVTRQWVNKVVKDAVGVGTKDPEFRRLAAAKRPELEIPEAFDLLADAAEAVRFLQARAEAARPLRDRLIALMPEDDVTTATLVGWTWLERAMVDRIRARGREA